MPFKLDKNEVVNSMSLTERQAIIPNYAGQSDPRISVQERCSTTAEISFDTDFSVVATDGNEIQEVIKGANGLLGQFSGGSPSAATLISGVKMLADTISSVLTSEPQSLKQEIKFNIHPCTEEIEKDKSKKGKKETTKAETPEEQGDATKKKYKIELEVIGAWVISDDEARHDPDEHASVGLLLFVNGEPAPFFARHIKRVTRMVEFPIRRSKDSIARFRTEITTDPVELPLKVYARCTESAQTNGPGNSALNPLDVLEDAFTNSVSAVRIDYINFKITEIST